MTANRVNVWILLVFLCNALAPGFSAPMLPVPDPEEAAGKTEGDMVLSDLQIELLRNPIRGRNGLLDVTRRWPDRVVFYKIEGSFEPVQVAAIMEAIETLESRTCVTFREADADQPHYVAIRSDPGGCFTAVGYQAKVQEMNLEPYPVGDGCFRAGTILHEFMHALGFYHEQSSADRDNYIQVLYENIVPGKEFNFDKFSPAVVSDFGVGYDYDSCLHYRSIAFSANGEPTIVPLDPSAEIGQREGMSSKDIEKINVMYKCPIEI